MEAREALLKARQVFLKIGDADESVARQAASEFRCLMDQRGITLENMYRFTKDNWRPIASRAIAFWMEAREKSKPLDPKLKRPKREREAWLLWQDVADALEMIAILNLREPPEDDSYYREIYDRSSRELKRLVAAGKYPRDLNDDGAFRTWRTEWDCW
ncbi:MAG: hypothetical protein V1792_09840 [Pseudomonadota bacterium]